MHDQNRDRVGKHDLQFVPVSILPSDEPKFDDCLIGFQAKNYLHINSLPEEK